MVPAETNYKVGQYTLDYMVENVRDMLGLRKLVREIIICLMEPRVRAAFMCVAVLRYFQVLVV